MIRWLYNKFKETPKCVCGWKMKSINTYGDIYSWTCVWKKCKWEVFQSDNGKLHWWKQK